MSQEGEKVDHLLNVTVKDAPNTREQLSSENRSEKRSVGFETNDTNNETQQDVEGGANKNETNQDYGKAPIELNKVEFILVFIGLACAVFIAALDQTIVATALPVIALKFNALDKIAWVGTAYLLTMTALQPTYGKLSDIFGRKITILIALFLFELGSLICGVAPNMVTLIIARAIAGLGGAGIISLVMIIISDIVSLQDRGKYQGIIGGCFGIASVVGPLLGGAFTDHWTWRWAFYINLPLGAITSACIIFFLHFPRPTGSFVQKFKRIDWWGTLAVTCATIALLLPLSWGGNKYKWSDPLIIVLLIVGVIGFILFGYVETFLAIEPLAPSRLFKDRTIVASFAVNFFHGMSFFALVYYIPLYFQVVKAETATQSGLELLPLVLGVVFAAILSGQLVSRTSKVSYLIICLFGATLITVGAGLISTFKETTSRGEQTGYLIIAGIGVGSIMQTTLLLGQQLVDYDDVAVVTSLLIFFRTIGAIFGVAIVGTVFTNEFKSNLASLVSSGFLPPGFSTESIRGNGSGKNLSQLPEEVKNHIIHAFVLALDVAFRCVIVVGGLTFISALFMRNVKPAKGNDEKKPDV